MYMGRPHTLRRSNMFRDIQKDFDCPYEFCEAIEQEMDSKYSFEYSAIETIETGNLCVVVHAHGRDGITIDTYDFKL